MPKPDPDKIFKTAEAAREACRRLNEQPPELGYSSWYVGRAGGEWWVVRHKGVMEEDLDMSTAEYERRYLDAVRAEISGYERLEAIAVEEVRLGGEYPDTRIEMIFRPVVAGPFTHASTGCLFGYGVPIWPAEYRSPEEEASFHSIYFGEHVGTSGRVFEQLRLGDCDPERINWL